MKPETRSAKNKKTLDKNLIKAIEEVKQGKIIGPFNSVKELRKSLEIHIRQHK